MPSADARLEARTLLERLIRERRLTFEEFAEFAERFAREHREPGTLSARHLQRLVTGRRHDGRPLGTVRPATARLLERIFQTDIDKLLTKPSPADSTREGMALRVAVAVVTRGQEVLMVRRRAEAHDDIEWQFPAGIIKPGRAPAATAAQEAFNETGIHCEPIKALGSRIHPVTQVHCEYVLCRYLTGEPTNRDSVENFDALWVERDAVTGLIPEDQMFPAILDLLRAA